MRAYPFGIPSVAETAISASTAVTASFLEAAITTASLALNLLGPTGSIGPTVTVVGPTGVTGPKGAKGTKGLGVYLLDSAVATCLPACSIGTTYSCSGDISVGVYQDGTYTGNNCTQEITNNQCGIGGCNVGTGLCDF